MNGDHYDFWRNIPLKILELFSQDGFVRVSRSRSSGRSAEAVAVIPLRRSELNGAAVASSICVSGAGTQQDDGQVILTLSSNEVLALVNHSSAATVTLQTLAGGTQENVNASLLIKKLAEQQRRPETLNKFQHNAE